LTRFTLISQLFLPPQSPFVCTTSRDRTKSREYVDANSYHKALEKLKEDFPGYDPEKDILVPLFLFSDATVVNAQTDSYTHPLYMQLGVHSATLRAQMDSISVVGGINVKVGDAKQNLDLLYSDIVSQIKDLG
jgi:hypothetical protein